MKKAGARVMTCIVCAPALVDFIRWRKKVKT